ncbi:hypothetical protein IKG31_00055 [Candidatus Saccharibacteria bacterium]|nr:hypothetical protein [Candidatus Saccharibacteria bacterium]
MVLVVIGLIIGGFIYVKQEGIDCVSDVFLCLLTGLLGALVGGLIMAFTTCLVPASEYNFEQMNNTPIIAMKDNQGLTGERFIFSGHVESELHYYYAAEEAQGISVKKIPASKTYIRYDSTNPHIEEYRSTKFNHWYTWIYAANFHNKNYNIIYAPEGTVDLVYEVDLE